jgi:penicillin-binding protein 2
MVPDPSWKKATRGEKWLSPTETYHFSIGQGYLSVTPLQVACMICAFANGGRFPRPRVLQHTPEEWRRLPLAPDALELVRAAMRGAVNDPGGTAYKAFHGEGGFADKFPAIAVAGKTGSAEHSTREPTHSWFAGYAPADSPEVAFAVIVERGGGGGGAAAGAAAEFLAAYFKASPRGEDGN